MSQDTPYVKALEIAIQPEERIELLENTVQLLENALGYVISELNVTNNHRHSAFLALALKELDEIG